MVSSVYLMTLNEYPVFGAFLAFLFEPLLFLLGRDCWLIFLICLRNPQDWSDGRQSLVARQHQPDRLLPCELWPPELETADSAAPQQPSSMPAWLPVISLSVSLYGRLLFCLSALSFLLPHFLPLSLDVYLSDHLRRKQGRTYWWCLQPGQVSLLLLFLFLVTLAVTLTPDPKISFFPFGDSALVFFGQAVPNNWSLVCPAHSEMDSSL